MNFTEKLKRLTEGKNKSQLSVKAGLPSTAISNYIARKYIPVADTALALARAIEVPLEWLVDDQREWPPPKIDAPIGQLENATDAELLRELAKRFRRALIDFLNEIPRARAIDWKRAADQVKGLQPTDPLPDYAERAMRTLGSIQVKFSRLRQDFDVEDYSYIHHDELPGHDIPISELRWVSRGFAWQTVEQMPHVDLFADAIRSRPEWQGSDLKRQNDHYTSQTRQIVSAVSAQSRADNEESAQRLRAIDIDIKDPPNTPPPSTKKPKRRRK